MPFRIIQVDSSRLTDFYQISIAFEVRSIYDVFEKNGSIELVERILDQPYTKDYDALDSNSFELWSKMNTSTWGIFLAIDEKPIGGAIVTMPDCALYDLRVASAYRRSGVGQDLFQHALQWAKRQELTQCLSIETQNTNVSACRFYAAMGAQLGDIDRNAYRDDEQVKDEIRLNWYIYFQQYDRHEE